MVTQSIRARLAKLEAEIGEVFGHCRHCGEALEELAFVEVFGLAGPAGGNRSQLVRNDAGLWSCKACGFVLPQGEQDPETDRAIQQIFGISEAMANGA